MDVGAHAAAAARAQSGSGYTDEEMLAGSRRSGSVTPKLSLLGTVAGGTMEELAADAAEQNAGRFYAGSAARGGFDGVARQQLGAGAAAQEVMHRSLELQSANPDVGARGIRADTVLNPSSGTVSDQALAARAEDISFQALRRDSLAQAMAEAATAGYANAESGRFSNYTSPSQVLAGGNGITSTIDGMPNTLMYQMVANVDERGVPRP